VDFMDGKNDKSDARSQPSGLKCLYDTGRVMGDKLKRPDVRAEIYRIYGSCPPARKRRGAALPAAVQNAVALAMVSEICEAGVWLRTCAGVTAQRFLPEPFGDERPDCADGQQQEPPFRRFQFVRQHAHGHVAYQQHRQGKGEKRLEHGRLHKRLIRQPRDVEHLIIAPHDALRAHRPETDCREQKHQRVMDEDAHHAQCAEAGDLQQRGMRARLVRGIDQDAQAERRVDERAQIHHAQRDEKPRVHGQRHEEIHFARADQFREVRAIRQEKCLIDLLDEIACADEHDHLPFRPGTDGIRLRKNHRDKTQLQTEPQELHDDPEKEIALERHLARHGIGPQRGVKAEIAFQLHGETIIQFC
jgi:hypothetical protein